MNIPTMPNVRPCARRPALALLAALLAACAPLPPASGPAPVPPGPGTPTLRWLGRVTSIEGPNALVDRGSHGAPQPAQPGQLLLAGDRFSTGPVTRMKIDLWNGGALELDENTDPSLLQDLNCLVVSLFRSGRIFVDKSGACVESLGTRSQQFSKVVYAVMPGRPYLQITVVEGEARTLQPVLAVIPRGWRIDLDSGGVLGTGRAYPVPEDAIRQAVGWTLYYRNLGRSGPAPEFPMFRFPRPPLPVPQYPPGRGPVLR